MSRKKRNTKKKYVLFTSKMHGEITKTIRPFDWLDFEYEFNGLTGNYYASVRIYNSLEEAIREANTKDINFARLNYVEQTLANIYLRRYYVNI